MMNAVQSILRGLGDRLEPLERWMILGGMGILAGFALVQIVLRNFFSTGFIWGDTFLRLLVLWIGFLGTTQATARNKHIHIILLPKLLPAWGAVALRRLSHLFSLIIASALCYASGVFVWNERAGGMIAFEGIPVWIFQIIFPLSFAVMALRYAGHVLSPPPEETEEGLL